MNTADTTKFVLCPNTGEVWADGDHDGQEDDWPTVMVAVEVNVTNTSDEFIELVDMPEVVEATRGLDSDTVVLTTTEGFPVVDRDLAPGETEQVTVWVTR